MSAVLPGAFVYAAAKGAVMNLSEAMAEELAAEGVGVTCLMPGPISTNIHEVAVLRPERFSDTGVGDLEHGLMDRKPAADWMDPLEVGAMVLDAIRRDQLFVFTHNDFKAGVEQRFKAVLAAFPRGPVDEARASRLGFPTARPIYGRMLEADEAPARSDEGE